MKIGVSEPEVRHHERLPAAPALFVAAPLLSKLIAHNKGMKIVLHPSAVCRLPWSLIFKTQVTRELFSFFCGEIKAHGASLETRTRRNSWQIKPDKKSRVCLTGFVTRVTIRRLLTDLTDREDCSHDPGNPTQNRTGICHL